MLLLELFCLFGFGVATMARQRWGTALHYAVLCSVVVVCVCGATMTRQRAGVVLLSVVRRCVSLCCDGLRRVAVPTMTRQRTGVVLCLVVCRCGVLFSALRWWCVCVRYQP